jgi:hypothetical protein
MSFVGRPAFFFLSCESSNRMGLIDRFVLAVAVPPLAVVTGAVCCDLGLLIHDKITDDFKDGGERKKSLIMELMFVVVRSATTFTWF